MFREIILPIFRSTRLCVTACGVPEDRQNNCPKYVELNGIINKPLFLHLVGCLYYLYQWWTVKQISDNEIYLLIKYIKSVLGRFAKRLSYIEDARCLNVNSDVNCKEYAVCAIYECMIMIGEPKYSENTLSFFNHKSHMVWPGICPGPLLWDADE